MSDKTIRLLVDLTYDAEMAHGDKEDAIAWFNDILMSEDLQLCSFSEFGDTIGKIKVVDQQEAYRIEELEAKLSKSEALLAKAVEAERVYCANVVKHFYDNGFFTKPDDIINRTTLAELKGQDE